MAVAKQEIHEQLQILFQHRATEGVQALRTLLALEQQRLNEQWHTVEGLDLTRMQGEKRTVKKLIRWIDEGAQAPQTGGDV